MEDHVHGPGAAGMEDDGDQLPVAEGQFLRQAAEAHGADVAVLVPEESLVVQPEPALLEPGAALANSVRRFREQRITLPTFAALANPSSIDLSMVGDADKTRCVAAAERRDAKLCVVLDRQQTPALTRLLEAINPQIGRMVIDASGHPLDVLLAVGEGLGDERLVAVDRSLLVPQGSDPGDFEFALRGHVGMGRERLDEEDTERKPFRPRRPWPPASRAPRLPTRRGRT